MHISTVSFNLPLKESQIPLFKQAILDIEGLDHSLYNNKINAMEGDGKNIHRYPLIQYRVFEGNATLWALNEGASQLEADVKSNRLKTFFWRQRPQNFSLVRHFRDHGEICEYAGYESWFKYKLVNYLPLSNHKNTRTGESSYDQYEKADSFTEKITILERVIVSHLILFSYAAGWQLSPDQKLKVKICDVVDVSKGYYKKYSEEKNKYFKKYDLIVNINARLPDGIAIGNQVSLGYGVLQSLSEQ